MTDIVCEYMSCVYLQVVTCYDTFSGRGHSVRGNGRGMGCSVCVVITGGGFFGANMRVHVCVCACVHVCVHVCMCVEVSEHVWRRRSGAVNKGKKRSVVCERLHLSALWEEKKHQQRQTEEAVIIILDSCAPARQFPASPSTTHIFAQKMTMTSIVSLFVLAVAAMAEDAKMSAEDYPYGKGAPMGVDMGASSGIYMPAKLLYFIFLAIVAGAGFLIYTIFALKAEKEAKDAAILDKRAAKTARKATQSKKSR